MRRVVITGLGLVTPLANGVEASWKKLIAGESGLGLIDIFDTSDLACKIAGEVPWTTRSWRRQAPMIPTAFNPEKTMSPKEQRRVDEFILYGMAAADEAIADSGWKPESYEDRCRTGVMLGSGIGGLATIADTAVELHLKGPRKISPFFIPSALINLASGQISIKYGLKGPNHAVVTACATGAPCHRRLGAPHPVRRCRRDDRGRDGSFGLPHRCCRLHRLPRHVHLVQRHAVRRARGPTTRIAMAS